MTSYRYTISYYDRRGNRLESSAVDPDWSAALEAARFAAVRRGLLAPGATAAGRVEPIWDEPGRGPVVTAFQASIETPEECSCTIPRSYFSGYADAGANALVARGLLQKGDVYQFIVSAYPVAKGESQAEPASRGGLSVTELDVDCEVAERPLAPLLASSMTCGQGIDDGTPVEVFVPQRVTAAALEACHRVKTVETGGVLIGHLRRAVPGPDVFVEVTAQVPVTPGAGGSANLSFSPATWTRVSGAIDLRGRREIPVGWWHFHPDWCRDCPPQRQAVCSIATDFFSAEDVVLHNNCFPRAFQVGLLFTERAAGMSTAMFGWHQGIIVARKFQVMAEQHAPATRRSGPLEITATPARQEARP